MRGAVTRDKSQRESGSRHTTDGGEATRRGTQVASGEAGKGKERGSLWSLQAERSPANALTFAPRGPLWTAGLQRWERTRVCSNGSGRSRHGARDSTAFRKPDSVLPSVFRAL